MQYSPQAIWKCKTLKTKQMNLEPQHNNPYTNEQNEHQALNTQIKLTQH